MKNKIQIIFFVVCLGELLAVASEIAVLQWVFKPLIMIVLGVYYFKNAGNLGLSKTVIAAIVFSFLGDVTLMFQGEHERYFMFGLASFLIAHLCYILAYHQHTRTQQTSPLSGIQKFRFALPIVLAGTGLITVLYNHLGDLKIPVTIYALVLIVMSLKALLRFGHTNQRSFWFVFIGALLFMVSDSILAINKFLVVLNHEGVLIMSTYMLAQFFIVQGILWHSDE